MGNLSHSTKDVDDDKRTRLSYKDVSIRRDASPKLDPIEGLRSICRETLFERIGEGKDPLLPSESLQFFEEVLVCPAFTPRR